jgi:hypothetical protein
VHYSAGNLCIVCTYVDSEALHCIASAGFVPQGGIVYNVIRGNWAWVAAIYCIDYS